MMRYAALVLTALLVVGCGAPPATDPAPPPRVAEPPPRRVEAAPPVPAGGTEFERVRGSLLERGILRATTPTYRVGQIVEAHGSRFTLRTFVWFERGVEKRGHMFTRGSPSATAHIEFFGEKKRMGGDHGSFWDHSVHLIIDDRGETSLAGNHRDTKDGYRVQAHFVSRVPDFGTHDYVLVLIRIKAPPGMRHFAREPKDALREGDVAFIVTREDVYVFRAGGR